MKPVRVGEDVILVAPCCEAHPVRGSWLRECARCGVASCRVCLPDGEPVCRRCDPSLPYDRLGLPLTEAA